LTRGDPSWPQRRKASILNGLASQAVSTIAGTAVQGVVRFLIPVLVARLIGADALATTTLILSTAVLLSMVWPTPAGTIASRVIASPDLQRSTTRTLILSTVLALVVLGPVGFVVVIVLTGDFAAALVALVVIAAYSGYYFVRGFFLGQRRAGRLALWEILAALVALGGTFALIAVGATDIVLLALGGGYLIVAIVGWPRIHSGVRSDGLDRPVLGVVAQNAVAGGASNGLIQLAMVITFAFSSSIEAAAFAAAFSLATPTSMVGQALNQVLIPHLAAVERSEGWKLLRQFGALCAATVAVFALAIALSPFIVFVVYGDEFAAATPTLQVLLIAMALFTMSLFPAAALTAWGRAREYAIASCVGLVVGVGAMLLISGESAAAGIGLCVGTGVLFVATTLAAVRGYRR
jgi:O-antigen/teichoic acid export membrane protein